MATKMDGPGGLGVGAHDAPGGAEAIGAAVSTGAPTAAGLGGPAMDRVLAGLAASLQRGELGTGPELTEAFVSQMVRERLPHSSAEELRSRAEELASVLLHDAEFQRRLARMVRQAAGSDQQ